MVDPFQPEIILYEPTPWGPKLTGADYIVDAEHLEQDARQAPELDGQIFHFFDAPNRFGLRPFYTLPARLGVEGQPDGHLRELEQGRAVRRAQRAEQVA